MAACRDDLISDGARLPDGQAVRMADWGKARPSINPPLPSEFCDRGIVHVLSHVTNNEQAAAMFDKLQFVADWTGIFQSHETRPIAEVRQTSVCR
jgi:hypothetical protein